MKTFLALVVLGAGTAGGAPPDDLRATKAATAKFHSFKQALRHGYTVAGEPCVPPAGPRSPAMGIHAINPALMADPAIVMPVHYDLHVRVWESNPLGMFAMVNSNLACP